MKRSRDTYEHQQNLISSLGDDFLGSPPQPTGFQQTAAPQQESVALKKARMLKNELNSSNPDFRNGSGSAAQMQQAPMYQAQQRMNSSYPASASQEFTMDETSDDDEVKQATSAALRDKVQQRTSPVPIFSSSSSYTSSAGQPSDSMQQFVKKITQEDRDRAERMAQQERKRWETITMANAGAQEETTGLLQLFGKVTDLSSTYKMQDFEPPEIVIVGMQSDGKSSFLEALLGFQFNTVDTQIGTRRPLILKMVNDAAYDEPFCQFAKEDNNEVLESEPTPIHQLEREIRRRTDALCGTNSVAAQPIIINVRYKHCSNLNVIDTPGFRKNKDEQLSKQIQKMNLHLIAPKNRIIVCLEQSTVEWCNSLMRPLIQRVDKNFERTIFVATKFNNRCNQFKSEVEINSYLEDGISIAQTNNGAGSSSHHGQPRFFFMSLPSGAEARNLTSEEFKEKILEQHLADYQMLCKIGFEEQKFRQHIGFARLKAFLEKELFSRYSKAVEPMIQRFVTSIEKRVITIQSLQQEIQKMEAENVPQRIDALVGSFVRAINRGLHGTTEFDTARNGLRLDEERDQSKQLGIAEWPKYPTNIPIRNENYKLYGGPQLDRLLAEFEVVAHSQEFPETNDDEIAVSLCGTGPLHTCADVVGSISDLAQSKAVLVLRPLIDILLQRAEFVMNKIFSIVADHLKQQNKKPEQSSQAVLPSEQVGEDGAASAAAASSVVDTGNAPFFEELQSQSRQFIDHILQRVKVKAQDEFDTFSRVVDWEWLGASQQPAAVPAADAAVQYDLLKPSEEDTRKRVLAITQSSVSDSILAELSELSSRELTEERCRKIKTVAARLFGGMRGLFVKYMKAKFSSFFLTPIYQGELDQWLRSRFHEMGEDRQRELMGQQIGKLKQELDKTNKIVEKLDKVVREFKDLHRQLSEHQNKLASNVQQ